MYSIKEKSWAQIWSRMRSKIVSLTQRMGRRGGGEIMQFQSILFTFVWQTSEVQPKDFQLKSCRSARKISLEMVEGANIFLHYETAGHETPPDLSHTPNHNKPHALSLAVAGSKTLAAGSQVCLERKALQTEQDLWFCLTSPVFSMPPRKNTS